MGTIIVGIDGSASSDSALDWALAEARLRSSSLRAIHAWQTPIGDTGLAVPGFPAAGLPLEQREELRSNYRRAAQSLLDEVLQRARKEPFLELDAKIVEGSAAEILIAAAEAAELLVLGSRGRGAVAGLLLGSVSQHCVQHALSPVVILPAVPEE